MGWQMWVGALGGLLAVIGQFWGADMWLPLIGGLLALIASLVK